MKFNSSARFNRKSFNSEKLFDAGIHTATVTNEIIDYGAGVIFPLTGWIYRKEITLTNAGAELTDYQLCFTIYRSSGADSGRISPVLR